MIYQKGDTVQLVAPEVTLSLDKNYTAVSVVFDDSEYWIWVINNYGIDQCYPSHIFKLVKRASMTKVTVIGEENKECTKKKPIEFVSFIDRYVGTVRSANFKPSDFSNINVYLSGDGSKLDVFNVTDADGKDVWYLGHFNDGVVE